MASPQETQERNGIKDMAICTNIEEVSQYNGNKTMPFVIGNEICEKLGSIGTSTNLLVYLTTVFNMKAITATNIVNLFSGTCNFACLPGAILCDTFFGRYHTLAFASLASFMGMLVLTLTAAIAKLHPLYCDKEKSGSDCDGATPWQMAILLSGFGLMAIGSGGIRPCNLAFGADQFDPNTESGKKGIKRFFNIYYFTLTFAVIFSFTVIAYVQSSKSWALGLAIPTFLMFLSCVLFFMGSRFYVKVKANGSPLTSVARVVVAAVKKRRLKSPEQPWLSLFNHNTSINSKLPYTDQFRFLDKAAIIDLDEDIINQNGSSANPWRLCSMQQVEEVKCLMRVFSIWTTSNIYYIAMTQQQTFTIFQALQSNRHFGNTKFLIPPASYSIFIMIGVTIWIPIYDKIVVPTLRRFTGNENGLTLLQRMASGMVLSAVSMFLSGFVEERRRSLALTKAIGIEPGRGGISPVSGFWLVPQLTLMGFSEALTIISHIKLYYNQFPENMRSISGSFLYIGFGVSSYLSSLLVSVVHHMTKTRSEDGDWLPEDLNRGRLDCFYYLVGALQVLNLGYFVICAKWYKYKGKTSNAN